MFRRRSRVIDAVPGNRQGARRRCHGHATRSTDSKVVRASDSLNENVQVTRANDVDVFLSEGPELHACVGNCRLLIGGGSLRHRAGAAIQTCRAQQCTWW